MMGEGERWRVKGEDKSEERERELREKGLKEKQSTATGSLFFLWATWGSALQNFLFSSTIYTGWASGYSLVEAHWGIYRSQWNL